MFDVFISLLFVVLMLVILYEFKSLEKRFDNYLVKIKVRG